MYSSGATDDEEDEAPETLLNDQKEQDLAKTTPHNQAETNTSTTNISTQDPEPDHPPLPTWTDDKSDVFDGQGFVRCDGPCSQGFYSLGGMRMCRLDGQVFCNDCYALPEGRSWRNSLYVGAKCSPSHEFFNFPPVATQCEDDELLLDGKIMKKREWIARIRKDLGISK